MFSRLYTEKLVSSILPGDIFTFGEGNPRDEVSKYMRITFVWSLYSVNVRLHGRIPAIDLNTGEYCSFEPRQKVRHYYTAKLMVQLQNPQPKKVENQEC